MKKEVIIRENHSEASETVFKILLKILKEKLKGSNKFNLAVSGGNTPLEVYSLINVNEFISSVAEKIHVFWVDERMVPHDDIQSNYGNFKKYIPELSKKLALNPINFNKNIKHSREEYREKLLKNLPLNKDGFPVFDLIILGAGTDGHTASVFPGRESLHNEIVIIEDSEEINPKRISLSLKTINNADNVIFLVTGEEKKGILSDLLSETPDKKFPAANVSPNSKLYFIIDKYAKPD